MTLYDKFFFPTRWIRRRYRRKKGGSGQGSRLTSFSIFSLSPDSLDVRWLLNVTYMLSGQYPDAVPQKYLIPPATLALEGERRSISPMLRRAAGLNRRGMAGGVIVDDFDNDGLFDAVISSQDDCVPLRYFHNNGDGSFTDRAMQAGLGDQTGGLNIIQTDYNNDGCKDILILRGGWEWARRKSLLRNNCDGTFTDVTRESGLMDPARATQTAVWTDIDNDGRLDLFIGNENAPAQLFLNNGDGTFTDIAESAGVNKTGFIKAVVAADFDNDGYPDLYVSNFRGQHYPLSTTIATGHSPMLLRKPASGSRALRSGPGSSTMTMTAGLTCLSPAITPRLPTLRRAISGFRRKARACGCTIISATASFAM